MKIILRILGVIILALALLAVATLAHAGLFTTITISEEEVGPYTIAYEYHVGSYYKVGPVMDGVYEDLKQMGIETNRGVGLYYDNPDDVPSEKLRSEVGSILEASDLDKIDQIKNELSTREIPRQRALVAQFPIKNMLSYMLAPAKVYKEMNLLWQQQSYPMSEYTIEIYDIPNKVITYIMPIEEIFMEEIILEEPIVIEVNKIKEAQITKEATNDAVKEASSTAESMTE
jgi:hypothetical protein